MNKNFTLNDLDAGMLVKLRNGNFFTVMKGVVNSDGLVGLFLVGPEESGRFLNGLNTDYYPIYSNYNDDLTAKNVPEMRKDEAIDEVWGYTCPIRALCNSTTDRELVWKREVEGCAEQSENEVGDEKTSEPKKEEMASAIYEVREAYKNLPNDFAKLIIDVMLEDLPKEHVAYIKGETDVNPFTDSSEEEDTSSAKKSLADLLSEADTKMTKDGFSVEERNSALVAAVVAAIAEST